MDNKVVLISGCSSGIGRSLAEAWRQRGFVVYATARRKKALEPLAAMGIRTARLDVLRQKELGRIIDRIAREAGRLDILVNNAGYGAIGPAAEMPMTELRRQMETNALAPMALIQKALPLLRRTPQSTIVQVGSVSAAMVTPFSGAYSASKAALHALSDALRMEVAPFGIRVLIVAPGAIRSQFGRTAENGLQRTIIPGSLYHPIRDAIESRSRASQARPSPAGVLAERIIRETERKHPCPVLRYGAGAYALLYLKRMMPERLLDRILTNKYHLNKLRAKKG